MEEMNKYILVGFFAGVGYLAAQELWWVLTGLAGLCHE